MRTFEGIQTYYARSRGQWRRWLARHCQSDKPIFLIMYHKKSKTPSVGFQDAIEEAICFGWIDSKGKKRSDDSFYLRFSKRNPKSNWGKRTRERANKMIAEGLMTESGYAAIEFAKKSGTWDALIEAQRTILPSELQYLLKRNRKAYENFRRFAPSSKRIILEWIAKAKRSETRQKRIAQTVELAEVNMVAGLPGIAGRIS